MLRIPLPLLLAAMLSPRFTMAQSPGSPPPIREDEVLRIAQLAHLELTPEEISRMTRELGRILAYVQQLEELDVSGVPATTSLLTSQTALRSDVPHESLSPELALREAPRVSQGGFAVPGFVDEG